VALEILPRQLRLDDLAFERALRVLDAEVADQLLGDRRAALDRLAGFEVGDGGADDALVVDPAVLVEALVLDRHRRQLQLLRDPLDRDRRAGDAGGDPAEAAAVGRVDRRVAALAYRFAGAERRCVGGDVQHPGGDRDHGDRDHGEQAAEDHQQLRSQPRSAALTAPDALRHPPERTRSAAAFG
jgi:hypothetical protein